MLLIHEFTVPIQLVSEMNVQQHWTKRYKRSKSQKMQIFVEMRNGPSIPLPCHILLTRYHLDGKAMDFDNLVPSFKFIRDEIANALIPGLLPGRADDDARLSWGYDQQVDKKYSVKVSFFGDY